jgi:hypothetical protein
VTFWRIKPLDAIIATAESKSLHRQLLAFDVSMFGIAYNRRILDALPAGNGRIITLVGTMHRLLRAHAPPYKVSTHRGQRYTDPVLELDQGHHQAAQNVSAWKYRA